MNEFDLGREHGIESVMEEGMSLSPTDFHDDPRFGDDRFDFFNH